MIISVESKDLISIAEEIQRNCDLLSYTDAEDAEDDVAFYVPAIRQLADELEEHAERKEREALKGGGS